MLCSAFALFHQLFPLKPSSIATELAPVPCKPEDLCNISAASKVRRDDKMVGWRNLAVKMNVLEPGSWHC